MSNTATRILVSLFAIPAIVMLSYFGQVYFLCFVIVISGISFYEFAVMSKAKGANLNVNLGLLAVIFLIVNQHTFLISSFSILTISLLAILIVELFRNNGSAIQNLGSTLLGILYFGVLGGSLVAIREIYPRLADLYDQGGYLIISILAAIWICDSAAFFGGTAIGKHKLFPRVSPKKTWEGAIFGFVFAILTMILAKNLVLDFLSLTDALIIGVIIGTFGQIGDLIESLIKRDAGVKDSSNLIPGHGGIYDRFDSLLFSAPFIYLYIIYFA